LTTAPSGHDLCRFGAHGGAFYGVAKEAQMLWALILILLILWLLGFIIIDTSLIHLLLVIALIILIYQLVTGRRAV